MKTIDTIKNLKLILLFFAAMTIASCSNDDAAPAEENELEVITDVTLVFTPTGPGSTGLATVRASAEDPDGEGIQELAVKDAITLSANTTYTLTFEIFNNLETPGEDIGEEIEEEDDEHQIFFSFSNNAFASPTGAGNISPATGSINYNDEDSDAQDGSGNPVGLSTSWTTGTTPVAGGSFTARLQHQPDVKTATSTSNDGEPDFNLVFVLNIQ